MTNPRFLVAKYAPDLRRMEPRNIGVIVWAAGQVAARFLGERPDGKVKPPSMVAPDSRDAYRQWVHYWRLQIAKPVLDLAGRGPVMRHCPEFLDAIRTKSKPQFILVEAGSLLESIATDELPGLVDELFDELVEPPAVPDRGRAESEVLRESAANFFIKTQLAGRPDFHAHFPQVCKVHGILREIHFDNAVGDVGRPLAVFQRVLLLREQSVGNALHMLDWYGQTKAAPPQQRRFALVHSQEAVQSSSASANLSILNAVATVIDLASPEEAQRRYSVAAAGI